MDSKHIVDYHGRAHCYWCGKPIQIEVDWDEYTRYETRRCNCDFATRELDLKAKLQECNQDLRNLECNRPGGGKNTEYRVECERLSYKYRGRGL